MKYLLDTHIVVWIIEKPTELTPKVKQIIENTNALYVSVESLREIAIKSKSKEILLKTPFQKLCTSILKDYGIKVINTDTNIVLTLQGLETPQNHKDPFDLLIIATALTGHFTLISADRKFPFYTKQGLELLTND